jgi:hypothetical protein
MALHRGETDISPQNWPFYHHITRPRRPTYGKNNAAYTQKNVVFIGYPRDAVTKQSGPFFYWAEPVPG